MATKIKYSDTTGIDYIKSINFKLSNKHIKHLNHKVTLPMFHAATIANINAEGRRKRFADWSPAYKTFRKKAIPNKHTANKQPEKLGKQEPKSTGIKLVFTKRFFHNLGTRIGATAKSCFYGVRQYGSFDYVDAVVNGRSRGVKTVTVPSHVRKAYTKGNGTTVSSTVVREHKKRMKTGIIPKRDPFYLMPPDVTSIEKAFVNYIIALPKEKSIKISTRLRFTAPKVVNILTTS